MRKNSLLSFFVLVLAGILFAPYSLSRMMAQDRIPVCPPLNKVQKGEEIEPVELVTDARKEEFIRSQQHKLAKKSRTRRTAEPRK